MTTHPITFGQFIASLSDVRPNNLEHCQARARHIHNEALQIIADGPFPSSARTSFPILKDAENKTDVEIAVWWGRFSEWFESLPFPQWKLLSETNICP